MTNPSALTTTIEEPSPAASEIETLLFALGRARAQFAWKCGGLDAAALRRTFPPSAMTLGGLLKHMAAVEQRYAIDFTGRPPGPPLDEPAAVGDPDWFWRSAADDPPERLYALWRAAVDYSQAAMIEALADGGPQQPAKYTTYDDGQSPNLRRILADLNSEYARHVGHADLFREAIDGLVGEDPPQPC